VGDHCGEKQRVEPREWTVEASDEAPVQRKVEVACVVDLAGFAVWSKWLASDISTVQKSLTPPGDKNRSSIRCPDDFRVLQRLPWQLRERLAEDQRPPLLLTVTVLLAVGRIPHPVNEQVRNVQEDQDISVPAIGGRVVVGEVDGAVAVTERDPGQIPENEHESPLFVVHVP
jgi:hypothetical protein